MVSRLPEADRRPTSPPEAGFVPTSGVAFQTIACKLIVVVTTAASTFSIRDLTGTTVSLGTLPVGVYTFDIQCDLYTAGTPGNVTVAAFYRQ